MRRRLLVTSSVLVMGATVVLGCSRASDDEGGEGIQPIEAEEGEADSDAAGEPEVEPEPAPDPEPEAETEREDPFAFDDPSEIDLEYVDRVMAELLAVESAVLDDVLESDSSEGLTEQDSSRLRAVLSGPRLVDESQDAAARARDLSVRDLFLATDRRTGLAWNSELVVAAVAGCVVAIGQLDNSGVAVEPYSQDESAVVVLSSMGEAEREEHRAYNRTPWRIHEVVRLVYSETGEPVPRDAWDDLPYAEFLDLPCEVEL